MTTLGWLECSALYCSEALCFDDESQLVSAGWKKIDDHLGWVCPNHVESHGKPTLIKEQPMTQNEYAYYVKLLQHTRLEGLQQAINAWLQDRKSWIVHVDSVTLSKSDSFHYACIVVREHAS